MKRSRRETDAISGSGSKKTSRFGNLGCALFSLPFFFIGLALLYFLGVSPVVRILRASSWDATPCVITSSRVASSGKTFSVDIHYSYSVEGKPYQGARYNLFGGSSSGYPAKDEVVKQNPVGRNTICYVNPLDPTESVFDRGFSWDMLWGLFGLPFLLVGGAGLFMSVRSFVTDRRKRSAAAQGNPLGSWPSFDATRSPITLTTTQGGGAFQPISSHPAPPRANSLPPLGRLVLEPAMSPIRKFMALTLATLFWNGIVSIFVGVLIKEWSRGEVSWLLALFLTPFVLIGLLLLFVLAHSFLALFNPRPRLTLESHSLRLGESSDLDWQFSGSAGRVNHLRLYLEGREEATYRQGTDTKTDKNTFATIEIANSPNADPGRAKVEIPDNTMHSFKSDHNKIIWEIHVEGAIRYWPDVDESFEIEVLPMKSRGAPGL